MTRVPALLIICGTAALAGCGRGDSTDRPPVVALVMKSLANEFFQTMEAGARAHHREHGGRYELIVNGTRDEQDVSGQIALVEQMIARGANAIVLAPADSKALVAVCRRAMDAGVLVVNIDNRLDADALAERGLSIPFVGPDNRAGARAVGEALAARLPAGSPVAILEGVPNAFNGIQRTRGFTDAMEAAGMVVVRSQPAYWETARAHQVTSAMMTERPEIRAILAANDSMALGAVAALRAAGRRDVLVAGFDNISAVRDLVRDGQVVATADQHADRLAVYGIEYALAMLETGERAAADRSTPVDLITAETLP